MKKAKSKKTPKKAIKKVPKKKVVQEIKEAPDPGIPCPRCRFTMRVYRTKKLTGAVARERICDRCGEKQDTEENVIE